MTKLTAVTPSDATPIKRFEGGSRRWQSNVNTEPDKPVITIITSTFNAARDLPWTIKSIREQTYPYVQWVVVDGASKDDTVALLRENDDLIDVWVSEPDTGIYDAWNKALNFAKGDWVQFIGAGDELASPDTLADMATHLSKAHPQHDIVYGRLAYISETSRTLIEEVGMPWEAMKGKWEGYRPKLPAHPSIFHHKSTLNKNPAFDTSYRIAADSLFLTEQLKRKDFLYIPILVDRMPLGGISGQPLSFIISTQEKKRIAESLNLSPPLRNIISEKIKWAVKIFILKTFGEGRLKYTSNLLRILTGSKKRWII